MKNIFNYLFGLIALAMFAACSPEEFEGANGQIPTLGDIVPVVTVDQEINQVTFSLPENVKGCQPVWLFYENKGTEKEKVAYSTVNGFKKIYTKAGDYEVEMKLMNRNGISDGAATATFHIDNTIVNFDAYLTKLCGAKDGDAKKEWRIANEVEYHMACGEPFTDGTNWWHAQPDEKAAFGVYDNRLTFGADYSYTFNPGESGTIYVNTGCSMWSEYNGGVDFCVPATEQTVQYEFEVDGDDLYIVFPAQTFFPYIANDEIWNTPRYKVLSITPKEIHLVIDKGIPAEQGGIAWHYILTSGEAAVKFNGFKYNAESNLWLPADADGAHVFEQYNATGSNWAPATTPEITENNGTYSFTLVEPSEAQWQSQFKIAPVNAISLSSELSYDFSVIITPSNNIPGATVKLTQLGDDGNFLFVERVDLTAFEDNIIYFVDRAGVDAENIQMVFDFGGNPANTEIVIKNIVIKDHAVDDGTVLPSDDPTPGGDDNVKALDYNSPNNLWKEGWNPDNYDYWYSPASWAGGLEPEILVKTNQELKVVIPEGVGGSEWQGQNKLVADIFASQDLTYDFGCIFNSSNDGVITVKLADADNDGPNSFFYENAVAVKAFEDVVFTKLNVSPKNDQGETMNYEKIMLVIDYGRLPAGTEISARNFVIQEHVASPDDYIFTWDMDGNLWASADVSLDWWYSASDWSGALSPVVDDSKAPREYKLVIPEGIGGSEWQGQTKFHTNIPASADKKYHFAVTLNSSEECNATVKLAWEGNDIEHAFFYVNDFALKPYEDCQLKMISVSPDVDYDKVVLFVDLGRTPGGAEVVIKDFVLVEN